MSSSCSSELRGLLQRADVLPVRVHIFLFQLKGSPLTEYLGERLRQVV